MERQTLDRRHRPARPGEPDGMLAVALQHLLARDDDRPARWLTPAFAAEVDAHRRRGAASVALEDHGNFEVAARRLATDPAAVAQALAELEAAGHRMGPWDMVVQRGTHRPPSDLDVTLWFG